MRSSLEENGVREGLVYHDSSQRTLDSLKTACMFYSSIPYKTEFICFMDNSPTDQLADN